MRIVITEFMDERAVAQLRAQHPELHFDLRPTVGSDARVIDLLAHMALQDCPPL